MGIIFHTHHMVPKYDGGSDDSSNLVKVNVAMHAFLHLFRWKEIGDYRDELAYKGLKGEWSKQKIVHRLRVEGGRRGLVKAREAAKLWREENPEKAREMSLKALEKATEKGLAASQTPEVKERRSKTQRDNIAKLTDEERVARFSHPWVREERHILALSESHKKNSKFIGFRIDGIDYWGRSYGELAEQFNLTGGQFRCAVKKNSKKHWDNVELCYLNLDRK